MTLKPPTGSFIPDPDPGGGGGGTGTVDTATLVGFCQWNGDEWTFDDIAILERPDFDGLLLWIGGDASTDDPTTLMGVGDIWYPESE